MFSNTHAIIWLISFAALFAAIGIAFSARHPGSLEDYTVARNSQTTSGTLLTLLATSLGAWILFSPAQAATWGGLAAVIGYAAGAMSPRFIMIPLGKRMREVAPSGHTLTEFVSLRYGRTMYVLVLLIMLFYMVITLIAEVTAVAKLVALLAPVPLWVTACIVMVTTLLYTAYGGLRASIFTDKVQMAVILPLLALLLYFGWHAVGGTATLMTTVQQNAPELLRLDNSLGVKAGITFFVAILLTGLFHQGNWQRVYSAKNSQTLVRGFLLGGLLAAPFIFVMGLFGLAYAGAKIEGDSSVALFSILMPHIPAWFAVALIPLALALVMSTADTAISAVSSIITTDIKRIAPSFSAEKLLRISRWSLLAISVPVILSAAQGYSVLYLFLLADLFCSAAAFPVFYGLYNRRLTGTTATLATLSGLLAGLMYFPSPTGPMTTLLESFLLAAVVPAVVTGLLHLLRRPMALYDFTQLNHAIKNLDD